jgi:hypothetical protein
VEEQNQKIFKILKCGCLNPHSCKGQNDKSLLNIEHKPIEMRFLRNTGEKEELMVFMLRRCQYLRLYCSNGSVIKN